MLLIDNFRQVTAQIENERGIAPEVLISAIEQALVTACKKKLSEDLLLEASIDTNTGEAKIFQIKVVVNEVEDSDIQISLKDARKKDPKSKIDSEIKFDVTPSDFGRIAALTAKQVIIQRIREAEKSSIYEEYEDKVGTILTGTVQRVERNNYLINLGRIEALLSYRDQIPGEQFLAKDRIRVYLAEINKTPRGPVLQISRTNPGLLKCLFELEIPEINDGIIEIMSIAREPGSRAKIAVKTNNPAIGAVGTCVGHMGGRIQAIIKELGQERIDVLEWHENPKSFISHALKPAKISDVIISDTEEKTALVVVPNDQLSLAIGKNGINVRLSVKLTGWKLDIINEDEYKKNQPEIQKRTQLSIADKIKLSQDKEDENLTIKKETGEPTGLTLAEKMKQSKITESQENKLEELVKEEASPTSETEDEKSENEGMSIDELATCLGISQSKLETIAEKNNISLDTENEKLNEETINQLKEKA